MCQCVKTIAADNAAYRDNKGAFSGDSDNAKKIVKLVGGETKDAPGVRALYDFQKKIDAMLPDYGAVSDC